MVRILHLFPNLMNLYGEYANITVLKKHLEDQGQEVIVDRKDVEDSIIFEKYDFIYMGSGTETNQIIALNEIRKYTKSIINCVHNNKVMLFTGNAMELFGKKIDNYDAINFFDFTVKHDIKRHSGDVIVTNDEVGPIVGFINRCSEITGSNENALFNYVFKDTNIVDGHTEGYRYNNLFCTHIIGPILVKNPKFMEFFVKKLLPIDCTYSYVDYPLESQSYNVTFNSLKGRNK